MMLKFLQSDFYTKLEMELKLLVDKFELVIMQKYQTERLKIIFILNVPLPYDVKQGLILPITLQDIDINDINYSFTSNKIDTIIELEIIIGEKEFN